VIALLRGVRGGEAPIDLELIDWFGLGGELRKRAHTLSGGTRQRNSPHVVRDSPQETARNLPYTPADWGPCSGIILATSSDERW
jgi:hypothetical protein